MDDVLYKGHIISSEAATLPHVLDGCKRAIDNKILNFMRRGYQVRYKNENGEWQWEETLPYEVVQE